MGGTLPEWAQRQRLALPGAVAGLGIIPGMQWIIPFAGPALEWETLGAPWRDLRLPHLDAWVHACRPVRDAPQPDTQPELSFSPPHEQAWAGALGLQVADGLAPLGGWQAARLGLPEDGRTWARVSPAHWQLGTEQVTMLAPDVLALDEAESRALCEAVRPLFEEDGYTLLWCEPGLWLVSHPELAGLPCASLDRVSGRNVDLWLNPDPRARRVRRLQNEVQMLLYTHPLNEARAARGDLPVNSFWLDGCGPVPTAEVLARGAGITQEERLRAPMLAGDLPGWQRAFEALDEAVIGPAWAAAQRGEAVSLTLCGERAAVTLATPGPASLWQRWRRAWRGSPSGAAQICLAGL